MIVGVDSSTYRTCALLVDGDTPITDYQYMFDSKKRFEVNLEILRREIVMILQDWEEEFGVTAAALEMTSSTMNYDTSRKLHRVEGAVMTAFGQLGITLHDIRSNSAKRIAIPVEGSGGWSKERCHRWMKENDEYAHSMNEDQLDAYILGRALPTWAEEKGIQL